MISIVKLGMAFLAGMTSFIYYLSTALPEHGPEKTKYDAPRLTIERAPKDIPEFASLFRPDTHPALRKQN